MFHLTREVRFSINALPDQQSAGPPSNSFGGFPSLTGLGYFFTLQVTLAGALDPKSDYLRNIKEIDAVVRQIAVPLIDTEVRRQSFAGGAGVMQRLFAALHNGWPGATLVSLALSISPFQLWRVVALELPMVRLSQKFEFSASHRLHNPNLPDDANVQTYGKCNNPLGHGHNYELQVTLKGTPNASGVIVDVPSFERTVNDLVIRKFDHKNLNHEVDEFSRLIPTVENIAKVIYGLLKPAFAEKLASVTVWETPKTWCEYGDS